jgi:hypothetical protein
VLGIIVDIVRKPEGQKGFSVLLRRWAAERTLARITAHRRLARDYERDPAHSGAMIRWAAINTMTHHLAHGHPTARLGRRPLEGKPSKTSCFPNVSLTMARMAVSSAYGSDTD